MSDADLEEVRVESESICTRSLFIQIRKGRLAQLQQQQGGASGASGGGTQQDQQKSALPTTLTPNIR